MAALIVGPLLRYVDETSAAIWVEVDQPGTVEVLDTTAETFTVHGRHYALVEISDLPPGTSTRYTVTLDGETVWPEPGSQLPPSYLRTLDPTAPVRLVFGSCRMSVPHDDRHNRLFGFDVLRAYGQHLAENLDDLPDSAWPTALLMLGDQVYADETSEPMQELIRARRDVSEPPGTEVACFEEYAHLYRLAWSEPWTRWLLSTVPSTMIFDDHDIRDDWNTSRVWRQQMAETAWWQERVTGGLGAYWLYQHLGNLSPDERAADPLLAALREADGDGGKILDEFAWSADQDPPRHRWSFARDFGRVRLVMLDTRCGRLLEENRRAILDDTEWHWVEQQLRTTDGLDHLLIGSSLPFLLPMGVHHIESWNEAVAEHAWGRLPARAAEAVRQAIDLEHWAAFGESFRAMSRLVTDAATRQGGPPPATISFLSGDVHYSYAATARYPGQGPDTSRVHQLVCSPMRNPLSRVLRTLNAIASFGLARVIGSGLARTARIARPVLRWKFRSGPRFDNALATLELDGREARIHWETAQRRAGPVGADTDPSEASLVRLAGTDL